METNRNLSNEVIRLYEEIKITRDIVDKSIEIIQKCSYEEVKEFLEDFCETTICLVKARNDFHYLRIDEIISRYSDILVFIDLGNSEQAFKCWRKYVNEQVEKLQEKSRELEQALNLFNI